MLKHNSKQSSGLTDNQSKPFELAYEAARSYRDTLPQESVRPVLDLDTAAARFLSPLSKGGIAERDVIQGIVDDADAAATAAEKHLENSLRYRLRGLDA